MPIYVPGKVVLRKDYIALDASYNNVSLLLHGNGPNGSTTITDNSPTPKTVTAVGNAQISTAIADPFGNSTRGVLAFDGTGDYLTVPANSAFDVASGNFTAECWFRVNANPGLAFTTVYRRALFANYANSTSGWSLQLRGDATSYTGIIFGDGDTSLIDASQAVSQNAWHHVAAVKNGSTCTLYFNGTSIGTGTKSTLFASDTRQLFIGRLNALNAEAWDFPGYIDDLRITKGVARYTANFTPPTEPFPDRTDG